MVLMKLKSNQPQITECPSGLEKPEPISTAHSLSRVFSSPRGSALVIAVVLMLVASMLIVVGARLLSDMNKQTQQQTLAVAEAENAARAGLTDAIDWFGRQTLSSPYVSYYFPNSGATPVPNPAYSYIDDPFAPTQNAVKQDTMDDSIGIVQQYPINGANLRLTNTTNLWARYEVHRQSNPATPVPAPTATYTWSQSVHDITGEKVTTALNGQGLIWSLYSTGYIYINNDPTQPYNQSPNKVLATAQMSTEIRKLGLSLPVTAAAICHDMAGIVVNNNGVINALSGGQTYYSAGAYLNYGNTSYPTVASGGKISPSNLSVDRSQAPNWVVVNPVNIFGMSNTTIKSLADFKGDASNPLVINGSDKLSYFNGNLTFDPASPVSYYQNQYLNGVGTGVIYVDNGNFTLKPVSATQTGAFFNGVIFCNGYVTIGEGNQVSGCVMAVNGITVGTGAVGSTEKAYLNLSLGIISREQTLVAVYREDKSAAHNFIGVPFQ